jgi:predicted hydrocarbon binding protein
MARNKDYVLGVLLKKEIALKSDEIAKEVEELIKKHFESHPEYKLERTQINRFTGIAYSSDNKKSLQEFIEHQAEKESKAKKKPWTANDLDTNILTMIEEIAENDSKEVFESALREAGMRMEGIAEEFECLFSWNNVPGTDSEKFLKFLGKHSDIDWMENAKVDKSQDGRSIDIVKGKNSAKITISERKKKANLTISDGRTHDLKVKKENDERMIYEVDGVATRDKRILDIALELLKRFATHFGIHYLYLSKGGRQNVRETEE